MTKFTDFSIRLTNDLMKDFPGLTPLDGFAVAGNMGHESNGLTQLQEVAPRGGRGGLGGFQWTGPRRVSFEKFCQDRKLGVGSYEATYGYLRLELASSEQRAISALKKAVGLYAKTVAFEEAFERAGVKAWPERYKWAQKAQKAYEEAHGEAPVSAPVSGAHVGVGAVGTAAVAVAASSGAPWWVGVIIGLVAVALIAYLLFRKRS
jgi:hypothetical protein